MDKTEQILSKKLNEEVISAAPDMDRILEGTHTRIQRRANRRRVIYSTPVVALLILMVYVVIPRNEDDILLQGSELLFAGWETSWISGGLDETEEDEDLFYERSVEYLIDEHYYSYAEEAEELLDEQDLSDFMAYLEEA